MVFGGSTVCPDTLLFEHLGHRVVTRFCDPCEALPKPCFNAAAPALTVIDSWYLYHQLSDIESLEYVFILNGINDARSNNISENEFSEWYRHIQFYDEAYILYRHPEQVLIWTPTLLHLIYQRQKRIDYLPKENFQNFDNRLRERFLHHGNSIKSAVTYRNSLQRILDQADSFNHKLVIGTFPYYHNSDYNLSSFLNKKLDYSESIFPTELYGRPADVVKSIKAHNEVVRKLAISHSKTTLIDLEKLIPKQGLYFNDICHLSPAGCEVLYQTLDSVLIQLNLSLAE